MKHINQKYLNQATLTKLKDEFAQATPFSYLCFPEFLDQEFIEQLTKQLLNESFKEKRSDLFHFLQTGDLLHSQQPKIKEFITLLTSQKMQKNLHEITGITTSSISLFGSRYQDTHHLLCHDDQLEDRKLAWFLYLSDLEVNQGGQLELFNSKNSTPSTIGAAIQPKKNLFAFFRVSPKSFHQVQEVLGQGDRLAISGWFHE